MAYELYMTFYEKSAYIDAAAVCGNTVVAYSSDPKIDASSWKPIPRRSSVKIGYKSDGEKFLQISVRSWNVLIP